LEGGAHEPARGFKTASGHKRADPFGWRSKPVVFWLVVSQLIASKARSPAYLPLYQRAARAARSTP